MIVIPTYQLTNLAKVLLTYLVRSQITSNEEEKTKKNDYADLSEYKFSFSKRSAFLHSRSETRLRKADDGKSFHTIDICIPTYVGST